MDSKRNTLFTLEKRGLDSIAQDPNGDELFTISVNHLRPGRVVTFTNLSTCEEVKLDLMITQYISSPVLTLGTLPVARMSTKQTFFSGHRTVSILWSFFFTRENPNCDMLTLHGVCFSANRVCGTQRGSFDGRSCCHLPSRQRKHAWEMFQRLGHESWFLLFCSSVLIRRKIYRLIHCLIQLHSRIPCAQDCLVKNCSRSK